MILVLIGCSSCSNATESSLQQAISNSELGAVDALWLVRSIQRIFTLWGLVVQVIAP